jgi:hypothetical protein
MLKAEVELMKSQASEKAVSESNGGDFGKNSDNGK